MADAGITGLSARQEHAAAPRPRLPVERKPAPAQADDAKHPVAHPKEGAPADPAGPRANCGDRSYLSMAVCMDRQCQQAAWRAHPQCAEFRRYAESRRRVQEQ
jgi:non-specific serine/threonine protein kinase